MSLTMDDSNTCIRVNSLHGNARFNQVSMELSLHEGDRSLTLTVRRRTADALILGVAGHREARVTVSFRTPDMVSVQGIPTRATLMVNLLPRFNYEFSNLLTSREYGDYVVVNSAKNLSKYLVYADGCQLKLEQSVHPDAFGSDDAADNTSVILIRPQHADSCVMIHEVLHFMGRPVDIRSAEAPEGFMPFDEFAEPYMQYGRTARQFSVLRLACMIMWSNMVQPLDQLASWTLYASNKRFAGMWSWDHAFGALALAREHPWLAEQTMRSIYAVQAPNGQIPDMLTDSTTNWNYAKPPVQPMLFAEMCRRGHMAPGPELVESFRRHVDFYLGNMSCDNGLCMYMHGNDSGQDNSTVFMDNTSVVSPDLNAFLIRDCEWLYRWYAGADKGKADLYKDLANTMLDAYMALFDLDGRPRAMRAGDGSFIDSDSIMPELAILIADKLPPRRREQLVHRLTNPRRFTRYGLASELTDSRWYLPDGYWRGPIWAPTTVLCYLGLLNAGATTVAREVARRYCDMVERNGFFENFDALTGKGLRDSGFMWSAAGYLFLLQELRADDL
jgi:hypothetical protein